MRERKSRGGEGGRSRGQGHENPATNGNKPFTASRLRAFASDLLASAGISDYEMADRARPPCRASTWCGLMKTASSRLVGYKEMRAVDLDVAANA
jgi:hypothetical protein